MLLKLDIARAFNLVSWPFLVETLKHLGFGNGWCECVSILLSTTSIRVLVMVTLCPYPPCVWLTSGRSSVPMLFTMVIDVLNSLIQRAVQVGVL